MATDSIEITTTLREFSDDYVNPREIPRAPFITSVESVLKARGISADFLLRQLQQEFSKYKLTDTKLRQSRLMLSAKIPEIEKTLEAIQFLRTRMGKEHKPMHTSYGLTESVFCEAVVPPQNTVHLWLGANVMCEYTHEEAIEMLKEKLESAKKTLSSTLEDLAWVQDQITTIEVNLARVYNYNVLQRRKEQEKAN